MKNVLATAATLALALGGCAGESSTGNNGPIGTKDFNLTLPGGYEIDSVNFQVTGNGITPRNGVVNVENSSELSFRVGNLPVANDYTITLTAQSSQGASTFPCAGQGLFDIVDNDVSFTTLTLTCGAGVTIDVDENGDIEVSVDVVIAGGPTCPVVTGITALPLETAIGGVIQLEGYSSSAPDSVLWTGVGGTFGTAAAAATSYTCVDGGVHTLTFAISKAGCEAYPSNYTVDVECTGPAGDGDGDGDVGGDGDGDGDVGGDGDGDGDVGGDGDGDGDVGGDGDGDGDVGGDGDGDGPGACQTCMEASCDSYQDINFAGPCFLNDPNGLLGEFEQPLFTQQCTDAVACSLAAPSACADNPLGPFQCYCGNQTIEACLASGPIAGAECVEEWNTAARCPVGDFVCTAGNNWSDLTLPSGYAVFTIECANALCATECGLTM